MVNKMIVAECTLIILKKSNGYKETYVVIIRIKKKYKENLCTKNVLLINFYNTFIKIVKKHT